MTLITISKVILFKVWKESAFKNGFDFCWVPRYVFYRHFFPRSTFQNGDNIQQAEWCHKEVGWYYTWKWQKRASEDFDRMWLHLLTCIRGVTPRDPLRTDDEKIPLSDMSCHSKLCNVIHGKFTMMRRRMIRYVAFIIWQKSSHYLLYLRSMELRNLLVVIGVKRYSRNLQTVTALELFVIMIALSNQSSWSNLHVDQSN